MITPGIREALCARMRVAVTRSCVAFPRVDPNPIAEVLWNVYGATAAVIGSTFPVLSPEVAADIELLTDLAVQQLLNKGALKAPTAGMSSQERKQYNQVGFGLDQPTAMHLYRYMNQYRTGFKGIQTKRLTALATRRNLIANNLVDQAAKKAYITMSPMERGETAYLISRPQMSM